MKLLLLAHHKTIQTEFFNLLPDLAKGEYAHNIEDALLHG